MDIQNLIVNKYYDMLINSNKYTLIETTYITNRITDIINSKYNKDDIPILFVLALLLNYDKKTSIEHNDEFSKSILLDFSNWCVENDCDNYIILYDELCNIIKTAIINKTPDLESLLPKNMIKKKSVTKSKYVSYKYFITCKIYILIITCLSLYYVTNFCFYISKNIDFNDSITNMRYVLDYCIEKYID